MKTPSEYLAAALLFERAARKTSDEASRQELQTVADTYVTLAKSSVISEQERVVLEELERAWRTFSLPP